MLTPVPASVRSLCVSPLVCVRVSVERELNIAHSRMDLSGLAGLPEARDLIGCMLSSSPDLRMSAEDAVAHPFFWSAEKQLAFLLEASDRFESEAEHSELRMCLEAQAAAVVGTNWYAHLDQALVDNLGKYRKYDCSSVRGQTRTPGTDVAQPQRRSVAFPSSLFSLSIIDDK